MLLHDIRATTTLTYFTPVRTKNPFLLQYPSQQPLALLLLQDPSPMVGEGVKGFTLFLLTLRLLICVTGQVRL